jgi:hypothetical protein
MGKTIPAFYTTGRRAVLIMANESEEKRQRFLRAACEVCNKNHSFEGCVFTLRGAS